MVVPTANPSLTTTFDHVEILLTIHAEEFQQFNLSLFPKQELFLLEWVVPIITQLPRIYRYHSVRTIIFHSWDGAIKNFNTQHSSVLNVNHYMTY